MKQSRIFSVLIIAVIVTGLVIAACNTTPAPIASQAIGVTKFNGDVEIAGKTLIKGVATFNDAANIAGAVTINGAVSGASLSTSGAISGASLTVGGVAQSGAIKYGTQSGVISGTTIAHGIGTTPTVFVVQNDGIRAATFTQTVYHGACDVTSCTVYLTQGSITTTVVDWVAGK